MFVFNVISRLSGRRNERSAHIWSKHVSGLDELLKTDFRHLSLNTLCRVSDQRFSGSYFLWTDRTDLSEQAIWDIYTMLTDLEDAYRTMKTEFGHSS